MISPKLARWAYLWNIVFDRQPYLPTYGARSAYPKKISLCSLWWRSIVISPLIVLGGLAGAVFILVGMREVAGLLLVAITGAFIGGLILFYVIAPLTNRIPASWVSFFGSRLETIGGHFVPLYKGMVSTKKRLCPIWDVADDSS